jgi:glycosyltransferase involved in cell wall biosynthesis
MLANHREPSQCAGDRRRPDAHHRGRAYTDPVRLAWFTPWPPQPSGIARCSSDLVTALTARGWAVDVFVDDRLVPVGPRAEDGPPAPGTNRLQSAHDFIWRAARQQYDLVVYQVGNSREHDFLWPYLFRWPGLAVLHDARLHHARARTLLSPGREGDYREELAFNHPALTASAAELAIAGFDGPYYYLWPMVRSILETSRLTVTHSRGAANELAALWPHAPIDCVPLGHGRPDLVSESRRLAVRSALGVGPDTVLFGVFGGLSPEKRVAEILHVFARTRRRHRAVHLVLAGAPDPRVDVQALAATLSLTDAVTHLGVIDDEAFDDVIAAVDVSLNLRWPTALETSGPWLRALATGRATVTTALAHQADVPALDPRDWQPVNPAATHRPVTVAIDILDEAHSLGLALDRLAADHTFREDLGRSARHYWATEHTLERMTDEYERVLGRAMHLPAPGTTLPDALRPQPWSRVDTLLAPFEGVTCELF